MRGSIDTTTLFLSLHVFMHQPRRHEFRRQLVGTGLQRCDQKLVRLAQATKKRGNQIFLADRSANCIELLRQSLDFVDVLLQIIIFVHHRPEEASTKKELVRQALLLEVSFQS